MTVTVTTIKKTRNQAVVKFVSVGGGQGNVSLADLKTSDQTVDFPNSDAKVTITGMFNSIDGITTINRGGNVILNLAASQQDKWDFSQAWGFVLDEQSNANINVAFSANGTVILTLHKTQGYQLPNYQLLKDYEK